MTAPRFGRGQFQFGIRLCNGDAGLQTPRHLNGVGRVVALNSKLKGHPQICRRIALKASPRDANHCIRFMIQRNCLPRDTGVTVEATPPESIAEDHHIPANRAGLFCGECASQRH